MPQLGQEWASTHTASTSPTPNELHWAAGFLEGEGTFGFRGATAAIHAAQTDNYVGMDLLDPVIDFVGLAGSLGMTAARAGFWHCLGVLSQLIDREAAVGVGYAPETVRCGR